MPTKNIIIDINAGADYTIHDQAEETNCNYCGCPLLTGDAAYLNKGDDSKVFCSRRCASDSDNSDADTR